MIAVAASGLFAISAAPAQALSGSQFQAGDIISDQNFFDPNAMSASQIQAFLDSEIHGCTTGNCLNVLTVDTTTRAAASTPAGNLICSQYTGANGESAATVIYKVQQACSVSARVILVTLQKEEGLVTKTSVSAGTLSRAMGYGCPDSAAGECDSLYYGFFNQVYDGARQLRRYGTPSVVGNYQIGLHAVQYSPNAACGAPVINIQNRATAALYNYTPYQPNAAALANLSGTGDACSSYGNRNFWVYYSNWFGDPTVPAGTPEGQLTTVTSTAGSVAIGGWAVDPDDVTGTVPVSVTLGQGAATTVYANLAGADLSSQYAGAGTNHYFSGTIAVTPGVYSLCVNLLNVGGLGGQGTLGCQSVTVPSSPAPVGAITTVSAVAGTISFAGWAVLPDAPTTAVSLASQFGTQWAALVTGSPNTAAPVAVAGAGPNQGYSGTLAAPPGSQTFCIWASRTAGAAVELGCSTVVVPAPKQAVTSVTSMTGVAGGVSVAGWAVWPDSPATSVGLAVQVGTSWSAVSADAPSTAAATAVPGSGPNHGFAAVVPLAPGSHSVCLWTSEPAGAAVNLGCQTVTALSAPPTQSHVDSIAGGVGGVSVAGWAVWPDKLTSTVNMAIQVGASWYAMSANSPSTEASTAVAGSGPNHGFVGAVPLAAGTYSVCIWAGTSSGSAANIGCATVRVTSAPPTQSHIDSIVGGVGSATVTGWAVWPDKLTSSVNMAIQVGTSWTAMTANSPSTEAAVAVSGAGPNHGFTGTVALAPGTYSICVWAGTSAGSANSIGCQSVTVIAVPPTQSHIDSIAGGAGSVSVAGWAVWPDKLSASVNMAVQVGTKWFSMTADAPSAEASTAVAGAGTNHGFASTIPLSVGTYSVCVWAGTSGGSATNIGCQTVAIH
jgi:hypothetical protein